MKEAVVRVPVEHIEKAIFLIRGEKVMLDRDLAALYGVETRVLNQAVRRNRARFPDDFMFQLTRDEIMGISQFVTSSDLKFSKRVTAFTEQDRGLPVESSSSPTMAAKQNSVLDSASAWTNGKFSLEPFGRWRHLSRKIAYEQGVWNNSNRVH